LQVGPELVFSTALNERAFRADGTRLELLVGGRYRVTPTTVVGPAIGVGLVRSPGTPAFRALLNVETSFGAGGREARVHPVEPTESNETPPAKAMVAETLPAPEAPFEPQVAEVTPAADAEQTTKPEQPAPAPVVARAEPRPEPTEVQPMEESLPPLRRGDAHVVHFASNEASLSEQSRTFLDALAADLRSGTGRIAVEGHGDHTGPDEWNLSLSTLRAEAVRRHLVGRGVDRSRIDVQGFGATKPVSSNDTSRDRAGNRRVEVRTSK
ncbi:MAG: OmpA family protein, partial [Myxococcaceae bacterium]